tara:strand:+ start:1578 stop:2267 length:690 start_codon:yes stop_codon:yes gene_type:complete
MKKSSQNLVESQEDREKFKVRLEARVKNAALVEARERLGLTQKQVAEYVGMHYPQYNSFECMRAYPSLDKQTKICNFYIENGIFLTENEVFPEELRYTKSKKISIQREIPRKKLISLIHANRKLLPVVPDQGERAVFKREINETVEEFLSVLKDRESRVLRLRHGIEDGQERTYKEIGEIIGLSVERIRQIEKKAYRTLRSHIVTSKRGSIYNFAEEISSMFESENDSL